MKRLLAVTTVILTLAFFCGRGLSWDWMDSWIDQQVSTGVNYYSDEKRGYLTFGTLSLRYSRPSMVYPFTFTPPRLSIGCGGIDILAGGFSFLDPDELVQIAQNVMTAAAFYAFKMALSAISPDISNHLQDAIDTMNKLNQIQFDVCEAGKTLAVTLLPESVTKTNKKEAWSRFLQESGITRNFKEAKEKIESGNIGNPEKFRKTLSGCSSEIREILGVNSGSSSLLKIAYDKMGLSSVFSAEDLEIIRGIIGDVFVRWTDENNFNIIYHPPCSGNSAGSGLYKILVEGGGSIYRMDAAGSCSSEFISKDKAFYGKIKKKMDQIISKISANSALTDDEINFLKSIPNVYPILVNISRANITSMAYGVSGFTARAWAHGFFENLLRICFWITRELRSKVVGKVCEYENENCQASVFAEQLEERIREWSEVIWKWHQLSSDDYQKAIKEMKTMLDMAVTIAKYNRMIVERFGKYKR